MFVSKKKYDELADAHIKLCNEFGDVQSRLFAMLDARARSNENLKLGAAASAKARRNKAPGKNFNGIIAVKGDFELALYDEQDNRNEFWPRKANSDLGMFYIFHDRSKISFGTAGDGWAMKHVL